MSEGPIAILLHHRRARAIALAALFAAGVALALSLARLAAVALSSAGPSLPEAAPTPVEQLVRAAESGAASIASWHLFGNALPTADPRSAAMAPDTSLDLVLRGLLAGDTPSDGLAIIADSSGNERRFAVGDEIVSGVRLEGVYPDRATVSRGGVIEALRLPRPSANDSATAGTAGPGGVTVQNRPLPSGLQTLPAVPGQSAAQPFIAPSIATAGLDWNAATAKLGVDAQQLAREVSVLPVMEGGRFVGVRVQGGRDSPLFAKLGLRPDDVVTAVNGIELDSPARAAEVARTLAQAQSASVTVRREGRTEKLNVRLQ